MPAIKDFSKKNYKKSKSKRISHFRLLVYAYFVVAFIFVTYHLFFANKVIEGVWINDINLSGMKSEDAVSKLNSELIPADKITIKIGEEYSTEILPTDIKFEYLSVKTTKKAFTIGRSDRFLTDTEHKIVGSFLKIQIEPEYQYDKYVLQDLLQGIRAEALEEVVESRYVLNGQDIEIEGGVAGYTLDMSLAEKEIITQLKRRNPDEVVLEVRNVEPILTVEDLDILKSDIEKLIFKDFSIMHQRDKWKLTSEDLLKLIRPEKRSGETSLVVYDPDLVSILRNIANEIDRNPRGQILEIENGQVIKFVSSEDGQKMRVKESAEKIKEALLSDSTIVELIVDIADPPDTDNEFGIKDLLGEGRSKFKGSIPGRIHNIELASLRVSGTLVPPDGIFSFNESVGEINRSTGYSTAWVISKGRTVLGDGGGVCQVSTTVFRAALDGGFPIVERNAHSYRVSYYEQESPVGIDATIYRPSVDLRFRNDTDGYLLVTSEFDADEHSLAFKIYGKDDGRIVEMTEPKVLSRSSPPSPVYENDPSLAKGVTRQVEYPVWGARTVFSRTVTKNGEIAYDDTFYSNYRAWAAVYRVGTRE